VLKSFDIPGLGAAQAIRQQRRKAGADNYWAQREVAGPVYRMVRSEGRRAGDPGRQLAVREPAGYEHPQRLGSDVLEPAGPRILPVTQHVSDGSEVSREEAFDLAVREAAADMAVRHGAVPTVLGWRDRRLEGR
jgi:hypothetical protein